MCRFILTYMLRCVKLKMLNIKENLFLLWGVNMENRVCGLECPGCGAPVALNSSKCAYCSRPLIIRTFNSVYSMPLSEIKKHTKSYQKSLCINPDNESLNLSAAYCYLKLKLYDNALNCFEKAIENNFDNSEAFFYTAITLLKGKKAFLASKVIIEKAEKYLNAAVLIEPKGIYYYLWSYIKYDFYYKKHLKTDPNYKELLSMAQNAGLSHTDVDDLFAILDVAKPSEL